MKKNIKQLNDTKVRALIGSTAALILLISVFLLVYGIYGWAFITTEPIKNYKADLYDKASENAEGGGVVFFGDSLTEMYDLDEHYPDLKVFNRGISGDTTDHMLKRLKGNVIALKPDVVIFLGGCNDLRHGAQEDVVLENISNIIATLKSELDGVKVIVQSLYPINTRNDGIFKNIPGECTVEKLENVNAGIAALCEEYGVTFVNMYPLLASSAGDIRPELVLPDGLHLRPNGYDLVTETLRPFLDAALSA